MKPMPVDMDCNWGSYAAPLSSDCNGFINLTDEAKRSMEISETIFKDEEEHAIVNTSIEAEGLLNTTSFDDCTLVRQADEDIKEIVQTVKNAVLSFRNVEQEHGVIGDNMKNNLNNANVIGDKPTNCDNLDRTTNDLNGKFDKMAIEGPQHPSTSKSNDTFCDSTSSQSSDQHATIDGTNNNQVNLTVCDREDVDLQTFNSFNYWYISPDMPLDLDVTEDECSHGSESNFNDVVVSNLFHAINNFIYFIVNCFEFFVLFLNNSTPCICL